MPYETDAGDEQPIREEVGAYRQADLEAMDADQLRQIRNWASDQWKAHEESHPDRHTFADSCRPCTYYELLAGAAEDLLSRHRSPGGSVMSYRDTIRHTLDRLAQSELDPRHVEASMRCVYGTLDHLGGEVWDRAVEEAATEVRAMGPEISEAVARSWGL